MDELTRNWSNNQTIGMGKKVGFKMSMELSVPGTEIYMELKFLEIYMELKIGSIKI